MHYYVKIILFSGGIFLLYLFLVYSCADDLLCFLPSFLCLFYCSGLKSHGYSTTKSLPLLPLFFIFMLVRTCARAHPPFFFVTFLIFLAHNTHVSQVTYHCATHFLPTPSTILTSSFLSLYPFITNLYTISIIFYSPFFRLWDPSVTSNLLQ